MFYSIILINYLHLKMEPKIKITINEIKKKLNNKKVIIDFFREQGLLFIFYHFKNISVLPRFFVIQL